MIPTILQILQGYKGGDYTLAQCLGWMEEHERLNRSSYVSSELKEIMAVADEKGIKHLIMGDDFAAMALNDILEKLRQLEAKSQRGRTN